MNDRFYLRFSFYQAAGAPPVTACADIEINALDTSALKAVAVPPEAQGFSLIQREAITASDPLMGLVKQRRRDPDYFFGSVIMAAEAVSITEQENARAPSIKKTAGFLVSCFRSCGNCFCGKPPVAVIETQTGRIVPVRRPTIVFDPHTKEPVWQADHEGCRKLTAGTVLSFQPQ